MLNFKYPAILVHFEELTRLYQLCLCFVQFLHVADFLYFRKSLRSICDFNCRKCMVIIYVERDNGEIKLAKFELVALYTLQLRSSYTTTL